MRRHGRVGHEVMLARQFSQQGLDALHHGRYAEAEMKFRRALEQCPANTDAQYQLANCLWKRGARQEAMQHLETALESSGHEDLEMIVELGYMQANVGRLDLATELAERAIRLAPDHGLAWQLRGDVHREQQQWDSALACYHRALSHQPDNVEVQLSCAEVYDQLDRPARVLATTHRVEDYLPVKHQPERLLVLKSAALQRLDRLDEAIEVLRRAAEERALSNDGLIQLATAQLAAGRSRDAELTIERAIPAATAGEQVALRRLMDRLAANETAVPRPRR